MFRYDYVEDRAFLKRAQRSCSNDMRDLVSLLREKDIIAQFILVGSGARNMVMQDENGRIDFDYNLNIQLSANWNCKWLKETVRHAFDEILRKNDCGFCHDSTSVLTTDPIYFKDTPEKLFSMDICIVTQDDDGTWLRLVNNKGPLVLTSNYGWQKMPDSSDVRKNAKEIKKAGGWETVREQYRNLKNLYLKQNDHNHPSFVCYIEAVNNVYNSMFLQ